MTKTAGHPPYATNQGAERGKPWIIHESLQGSEALLTHLPCDPVMLIHTSRLQNYEKGNLNCLSQQVSGNLLQ